MSWRCRWWLIVVVLFFHYHSKDQKVLLCLPQSKVTKSVLVPSSLAFEDGKTDSKLLCGREPCDNFKPPHTGAISHLEIPADNDWQCPYDLKTVTKWKSKYNRQKIEDLLFNRNILHFGQSKGTPWMQPFTRTGPIADLSLMALSIPRPLSPPANTSISYSARSSDDAFLHFQSKSSKASRSGRKFTSTLPSWPLQIPATTRWPQRRAKYERYCKRILQVHH